MKTMLLIGIFLLIYFLERIVIFKILKNIDTKERIKVNEIETEHYNMLMKEKEEIEKC